MLSDSNGTVNRKVTHNIVEQVNLLLSMGKQVILFRRGRVFAASAL